MIYCFFDLLIAYLGGERSLLILLHGRPPKYPVFPGNLVWKEVDVSDPYTFLFLKRGIIRECSPLTCILDGFGGVMPSARRLLVGKTRTALQLGANFSRENLGICVLLAPQMGLEADYKQHLEYQSLAIYKDIPGGGFDQ